MARDVLRGVLVLNHAAERITRAPKCLAAYARERNVAEGNVGEEHPQPSRKRHLREVQQGSDSKPPSHPCDGVPSASRATRRRGITHSGCCHRGPQRSQTGRSSTRAAASRDPSWQSGGAVGNERRGWRMRRGKNPWGAVARSNARVRLVRQGLRRLLLAVMTATSTGAGRWRRANHRRIHEGWIL